MCTRGGITEEVVNSLNSRNKALDALRNGIAMSKEIPNLPGSHYPVTGRIMIR
jgi:hypothetical protein